MKCLKLQRLVIRPSQRKVLKAVFEKIAYLSQSLISKIATKVDMSGPRVYAWFGNLRKQYWAENFQKHKYDCKILELLKNDERAGESVLEITEKVDGRALIFKNS
jgi:hypothetical protein